MKKQVIFVTCFFFFCLPKLCHNIAVFVSITMLTALVDCGTIHTDTMKVLCDSESGSLSANEGEYANERSS